MAGTLVGALNVDSISPSSSEIKFSNLKINIANVNEAYIIRLSTIDRGMVIEPYYPLTMSPHMVPKDRITPTSIRKPASTSQVYRTIGETLKALHDLIA